MQGVHQKPELIFTIHLSLFPQPGPLQMEAHSGDSVEGLASSLFFHSASPASCHGYDYCCSVGAVRGRGSNSCKLTSGFLARQMLNSASFS